MSEPNLTNRPAPPPPPRRSRLWELLDDRFGHRKVVRSILELPVEGGASIGRTLGSVLAVLFLVQCITGTLLAAFYSPSVTDAWASVAYIELVVTGGRVVRGIHHLGTSAMVILVGLHFIHVVVTGAYKAPREPNWWIGLALFALILAYPLTGYTLLWDQLGYWASKVRTGITGTVPLIGLLLQDLSLGGNDHGNLTLTRSYALHSIVLPTLTFLLIGIHIFLFRRKGYTPPTQPAEPPVVEIYASRQLSYDVLMIGFVILGVAGLGWWFGAPLGAPADPTANYLARPEWYFLPLFQSLKYFHGPYQVVGTVVLPGLVASFLFVLPLVDRSRSRGFRFRWPWLVACTVLLGILIGLGSLAKWEDGHDPRLADEALFAEREARRAQQLALTGIPPEGASAMMNRDPLVRGERIFRSRCRSCHALEGYVSDEPKGPDLTAYGSKPWLRQLLRDPGGPRFFGKTKITDGMLSYAYLSEESLQQLTNMLWSLKKYGGIAVSDLSISDQLVAESECEDCHDFEEEYAVEGPSLAGFQSDRWVMSMLENSSAEHLYGEESEMPEFKQKLSLTDRQAVVAFLRSLAVRADRTVWPFVDDPEISTELHEPAKPDEAEEEQGATAP
ncbi:MAG: cytochrome bc complex cytochrome b subunit [Myxococcales bacterium]|nr:cytochrome bc complex cytochrome b subunit [Myxococcales bacterium]